MDLLANQFGERCEIVLHDLTGNYESTIVSIRNGHVSGREVGGSGSNLGLELLRGAVKADGVNQYRYTNKTKEGKMLLSSSIYFRNNAGSIIGSLCINYDITDLIMSQNVLKSLTNSNAGMTVKEVLVHDTSELFEYLLNDAQAYVGKPVALMTREDKFAFIKFMDEHGAFLIKKAGEKVCNYLDISKYLLYNVLNESRNVSET